MSREQKQKKTFSEIEAFTHWVKNKIPNAKGKTISQSVIKAVTHGSMFLNGKIHPNFIVGRIYAAATCDSVKLDIDKVQKAIIPKLQKVGTKGFDRGVLLDISIDVQFALNTSIPFSQARMPNTFFLLANTLAEIETKKIIKELMRDNEQNSNS